ncbi:MAG: hypothetical protein DI640_13130 [Sphingomonas taxi]|uniref:Uncharacterized protein n=1 Tax=Sphingomonas taxi TaxID=1549858 RepID=A0A2W5APA5_9SPHN|nr:MAG: hypothetical protein DI640_13130 [Sphingomonas taxi]
MDQTQAINLMLDAEKIAVESVFVPLSKSRSTDNKYPTANWKVTLTHNGKPVVEADYTAGAYYLPSYKRLEKDRKKLWADKILRLEAETGKPHREFSWGDGPVPGSKIIQPNRLDVVNALLSDGAAIDYATFEDWASEFGYDSDSIKAKATYDECLSIGLRLRASLGDTLLAKLREAFADY